MYQRSKIQEESLYYESMKHSGKLPIVGVNTFLSSEGSPTIVPEEVSRSTKEEKEYAIASIEAFKTRNLARADGAVRDLQRTAVEHDNVFLTMMEACKICTMGQISDALYQVGGQYRRNM
jgi:methylmalonyl-CoA mutase